MQAFTVLAAVASAAPISPIVAPPQRQQIPVPPPSSPLASVPQAQLPQPAVEVPAPATISLSSIASLPVPQNSIPTDVKPKARMLPVTTAAAQKPSASKPLKKHCCELCTYCSVDASKLKRHMRTHTGEKPFKCELCVYASTGADDLKRHMRTHSGEKIYHCSMCAYAASDGSSYRRHLLAHTERSKYQCTRCSYSSAGNHNLTRHLRMCHPETSAGTPSAARVPEIGITSSARTSGHSSDYHDSSDPSVPATKRRRNQVGQPQPLARSRAVSETEISSLLPTDVDN
jgi:uncharacterized Zn-finger protein